MLKRRKLKSGSEKIQRVFVRWPHSAFDDERPGQNVEHDVYVALGGSQVLPSAYFRNNYDRESTKFEVRSAACAQTVWCEVQRESKVHLEANDELI